MIKVSVKQITSSLQAVGETRILFKAKDLFNSKKSLQCTRCCSVFKLILKEGFWICNKTNCILSSGDKVCIEGVTTPLDAVVNKIWEVAHRAHWD